ncbi:iron-containing redox enzyme family protein [Candidatus Woesearchaeota archaeon]|nr:iron-containing redox enzyme family protein [Candidatus Woesearchaeota archaeon]
MDFETEMKQLAKTHGAVDNAFLNRFAQGNVSKAEFKRAGVEFAHFSREWPAILATLLVNTPDENEAAELTKILVSELGDLNPQNRHELLMRKFLRSIDVDPKEVMRQEQLPTTKAFNDGLKRLFADKDHFVALGAEFALENMAIPMWDKIIAGLKIKKAEHPKMDIVFFTFHRALEEGHEDAMSNALGAHAHNLVMQASFRRGAHELLNVLEQFWLGMDDKRVGEIK